VLFSFVSVSRVIGCKTAVRNDRNHVWWGLPVVKLYTRTHSLTHSL